MKKLKLKAQESLKVIKNHAIKAITTRKYYSGDHELHIQINGKVVLKEKFHLKV